MPGLTELQQSADVMLPGTQIALSPNPNSQYETSTAKAATTQVRSFQLKKACFWAYFSFKNFYRIIYQL